MDGPSASARVYLSRLSVVCAGTGQNNPRLRSLSRQDPPTANTAGMGRPLALRIYPGARLHAQVAGYGPRWPPVTYAISSTTLSTPSRDLDSQEQSRSRRVTGHHLRPYLAI